MVLRKLGSVACAVAAFVLGATPAANASLVGDYYALSSPPGTIAAAESAIAGMAPTATFDATTVCFPSCNIQAVSDTSSLSQFLGGNYTNLSNDVTGLSNHFLVLSGGLNVVTAGLYAFNLVSDDGSMLLIDNKVIVNNDGDHGLKLLYGFDDLSAGLHSIEVLQFEDGIATGLEITQGLASTTARSPLDPATLMASVPEPSTWAMMILGFAGVGFLAYRRKEKAATLRVA